MASLALFNGNKIQTRRVYKRALEVKICYLWTEPGYLLAHYQSLC